MKKQIFIIILLNSLFANILNSQTLLQQIEQAYSKLDSVLYIEKLRLSFKENEIKEWQKWITFITEEFCRNYTSKDSINDISSMEAQIDNFNTNISDKTPQYVLNLVFKTPTQKSLSALQVDTTELCFNLFYFGKNYKGNLYVFCHDGKYSSNSNGYYIIIAKRPKRPIGNIPQAFKKVMAKKPKYLLYCAELGVSNILYTLNDKIYVYETIEKKEYELEDYFEKYFSMQNK
jgi:hypothetical protein